MKKTINKLFQEEIFWKWKVWLNKDTWAIEAELSNYTQKLIDYICDLLCIAYLLWLWTSVVLVIVFNNFIKI